MLTPFLQGFTLGANVERLTIAQVSDIHLGLLHREETLDLIISQLQELQPDLVVATGANQNEANLLTRHQSTLFTLLLKHRPRFNEKATGLFDLQLSGHAHRGQIFPFNYVTALEYPQQDGLYSLPGGGQLYTSRGTGTWGPPMRVLSPPEITLFAVVPEQP